jgi:hypothetical protein
MSSTNLTKNLKLPQFVASDKPSWLGDVNGAMLNIDNGYGTLTGDIANANATASSAKSQSDANTQTLVNVNSELESQGNRITALEAGGGTEQLEQRVGTLETDVESLQTRANTFEEEIAEGSTNITNLTGRVTTVEGKVKTNEDNITNLQATTDGLTLSTQAIGETANTAKTTANTANTNANSALSLAQTANTNANTALTATSQLSNQISNKSELNIVYLEPSSAGSKFFSRNALGIYNKEIKVLTLVFEVQTIGSITLNGTDLIMTYNVDPIDVSLPSNCTFNSVSLKYFGKEFNVTGSFSNGTLSINASSSIVLSGVQGSGLIVTTATFY